MAVEVVLPKVDMDMSSAVISRWHVKDGETVRKGQALFDIETDKAAMEIEAPGDGTIKLADLAGARDIAIGTIVAMIFGPGEEAKALPESTDFSAPAPMMPAIAYSAVSEASPRKDVEPSGKRATPLARSFARQARIDLKQVAGSGPRGRIVAADVRTHGAAARPAAIAGTGGTHFHLSATCNASSLLDLQLRLNAHAPLMAEKKPAWQLSISDFLVRALATALLQVTAANAARPGSAVVQLQHLDIAVAMLGSAGAHSALLKSAESKSLSAIASERTAVGKVQYGAIAGGSAGVCDLGAFGVEQVSGFINMPQAVVLAVGAPVEGFIAVAGRPVLAKRIGFTLTCDHRAIDVATGAKLLAAIKRMIEEPVVMLL